MRRALVKGLTTVAALGAVVGLQTGAAAITGGEDVLDVALGELSNMTYLPGAREGSYPNGRVGLSMATTSCNVGTVNVPWNAPMEETHPFIAMQLYREMDGRFEQIGVSWVKHGFYALSQNACSPCFNPTNGTALGVGCSDTYSTGNNAWRQYLGPREEIDPYAGTWSCEGSYFAGGEPDCIDRRDSLGPFDDIEHRLQAHDADLGQDARYFYEAYYVVAGDQNKLNNIGSRECIMLWTGASWSFGTPADDNDLLPGPAVQRWGEMQSWVGIGATDGDVLLAVDTTDRGDGTWRYEYALYNFDSDRQIRSFSIPLRDTALEDVTFHDWDRDPANDWTHAVTTDAVTWETDTFETDPTANALSFGLLFNFGFTTNAAPVDALAALGVFKPSVPARGEPDAVLVATRTPDKPTPIAPGADVAGVMPGMARIGAPSPNPTGLGTSVPFALEAAAIVDVAIFDAAGRRVRTLVDGRRLSVGAHRAEWDGRDDLGEQAAAGVYFARLRANGRPVGGRSIVLTR